MNFNCVSPVDLNWVGSVDLNSLCPESVDHLQKLMGK